ncbi:MFS transporter [Fretibacterium sp. OH1220_COT-178]|uniref:MFS transporter n=1 Tax=Fretibacterium sp. OH1220_COT-178 TaxID=2491047 RepID=UPI000F5E4AAC|nr:MFS transporter [Fretibacterium sp. OH1220_COT-178]RRD64427.1 MFS transporter [Fretibacterium sp. OH1220_COT-178]
MWNKIGHFLGVKRDLVGLMAMAIFVGLGERMAERFLPIYILALGGGAVGVGLLNGLDNLLSALYSFPGGYIADRFGTKRALLFFNLLAISGYLVVIAFPSWWAVVAGSVLFLSWTAISLPASMKLIASVLPQNKRAMGVTMHSLVRRIPMALGPVIGGTMIGIFGEVEGVRAAFVCATVFVLVALAAQQKLIRPDDEGTMIARPERNPLAVWREMPAGLRNLLASDILIRFAEQIPYAFVVVWCMKVIEAPVSALQFGVLTTVEMVVAMLVYIPVAWLADRGGKKACVAITFVFFTLFPLVLMISRSFGALVLAFVVRGLKEFGEPTRKSLIIDLSTENREASMFGLYYLIRDTVVSVGAFGGAFLWKVSPVLNLWTAFVCGALGTAWFVLHGTDTAPEQEPRS